MTQTVSAWPVDHPLPRAWFFIYHRHHIPTNRVTTAISSDRTGADLLRRINLWNRAQPGVWHYWWDGAARRPST